MPIIASPNLFDLPFLYNPWIICNSCRGFLFYLCGLLMPGKWMENWSGPLVILAQSIISSGSLVILWSTHFPTLLKTPQFFLFYIALLFHPLTAGFHNHLEEAKDHNKKQKQRMKENVKFSFILNSEREHHYLVTYFKSFREIVTRNFVKTQNSMIKNLSFLLCLLYCSIYF